MPNQARKQTSSSAPRIIIFAIIGMLIGGAVGAFALTPTVDNGGMFRDIARPIGACLGLVGLYIGAAVGGIFGGLVGGRVITLSPAAESSPQEQPRTESTAEEIERLRAKAARIQERISELQQDQETHIEEPRQQNP